MVFKSSLKTLTRIKLSTHYKFAISLKSPNKKECVQHLLPVQVPFTSKNHQIILNISVKRFCESGMFVARKPLKPVRFYEFYRRPNQNPIEHSRWSFFAKIVNDFQQLTVFAKKLHCRYLTKYASVYLRENHRKFTFFRCCSLYAKPVNSSTVIDVCCYLFWLAL